MGGLLDNVNSEIGRKNFVGIIDKNDSKAKLDNGIAAPFVFGFPTALILFFIVIQFNSLRPFNDAFLYLGMLVAIVWWAFSFALALLIFKHCSLRATEAVTVAILGVLIIPVGIQGSMFLGSMVGYPKFLSVLIYILGPTLFAFVFFTLRSIKNLMST